MGALVPTCCFNKPSFKIKRWSWLSSTSLGLEGLWKTQEVASPLCLQETPIQKQLQPPHTMHLAPAPQASRLLITSPGSAYSVVGPSLKIPNILTETQTLILHYQI